MSAVAFNVDDIASTLESMTLEQKGQVLKDTLTPKKFDMLTQAMKWDNPNLLTERYEDYQDVLILDMIEHSGEAGSFMHTYFQDEIDCTDASKHTAEQWERDAARKKWLLQLFIPIAIVLALWIFI